MLFWLPVYLLVSQMRCRWIELACAECHKWSTALGHETIDSVGQEVKDQGHTRPKIDLWALFSILLNRIGFLV